MSTTAEDRVRGRPARVGVLQAIRRYPMVAAIPTVLLALIGAALGIARQPTYTATSQLSVGQLNIADPAAVGSVLQATQQLASVYSRSIGASAVRLAVVRSAGPAAAGGSISATPIPDSPLIKVTATSKDAGDAVKLSNAASQALISYAQRSSQSGNGDDVARRFRAAALRYAQISSATNRIERTAGQNPSAPDRVRIERAQAEQQGALLEREGLRANYQAIQQTARAAPVLQPFSAASSTTSDRLRLTELLLLVGLLAGAALGAALATARLNRRVARLTRP